MKRKNKYLFVCCMLLAITLAGGIFTGVYVNLEGQAQKEGRIRVVTSFYPVYIAALNVAGDSPDVILENLSEPQTGCLHDYQLTPQDMILLSKADLFLVNGGGIENFLTKVGESYPELVISRASEGLDLLEEDNAHVWMDTRLYDGMVQNIARAFMDADPDNAGLYQANADNYCRQVRELTTEMDHLRETTAGEPVVIFHEAYAYIAGQLGMNVIYCMDLDEERQVSAHEVADVIKEITENEASVVFAEELYGKDMGDAVEAEAQAEVLYLDTLVRGNYEADSYLRAVHNNIEVLKHALETDK